MKLAIDIERLMNQLSICNYVNGDGITSLRLDSHSVLSKVNRSKYQDTNRQRKLTKYDFMTRNPRC